MTVIKNYNFSENEISDIARDVTNGNFLWIAFSQDASGNCAFKKVSANNPLQTYFDIDIATTEIKKVYVSGSYVWVALDDSSLIGKRLHISNPIGNTLDLTMLAGITEAPVDVLLNGSYIYFLIPGDLSGTNAKILEYTWSTGIYNQTIDLTTVTNAKSFTVDDNDEIWVVTYTNPGTLVRVYDLDTTPQFTVI